MQPFEGGSVGAILQGAYVALGIVANAASQVRGARTGKFLTPVKPVHGMLMMAIYAAFAFLSARSLPAGRAGLAVVLLVIAYGGIYRHWRPPSSAAYASACARHVAMGINAFGVAVTVFTWVE